MDMIKIGDSYITTDAVTGISPDKYDSGMLRVFLVGGKTMYVKASMAEAEVALMDAGLIEPCVSIPSEDIDQLFAASNIGYTYIAKDKTGAVYVYQGKPERNGAYWEGGGDAAKIYAGDFDWLSADDDEPTSIPDLLAELYPDEDDSI